MTSGCLVDINEAGSISQLGFLDKGGRALRRGDMQKVIVKSLELLGGIVAEDSQAVLGLDFNQFMLEIDLDTALISKLLQNTAIVINTKDLAQASVVDHVGLVANALTAEGFFSQKDNLCGSTGALFKGKYIQRVKYPPLLCIYAIYLQRSVGESEQGVATLELLNEFVGLLDAILGVVGSDTILTKSLGKALDLVPVNLDTSGDDEIVVRDSFAVAQSDLVVIRVKSGNALLDPISIAGNKTGHGSLAFIKVLETTTNVGPQRLVLNARETIS